MYGRMYISVNENKCIEYVIKTISISKLEYYFLKFYFLILNKKGLYQLAIFNPLCNLQLVIVMTCNCTSDIHILAISGSKIFINEIIKRSK